MSPSNTTPDDRQYDIFKEGADERLLWVEVVTGMEEAKKRLMSLSSTSDARYRLYDSATSTFIDFAQKKSA